MNLNQDHPSKKCFFWSNPYKIEIMITSLIEMQGLLNFGYMTTSTIQFESHFVGDVIDINYDLIIFFFQNIFILRRPGEAIFADITKIVTSFIKKIFIDWRKIKRIISFVSKCNLYMYFLILKNLLISGEKKLMSEELRGCVTWFIYFWSFLGKV